MIEFGGIAITQQPSVSEARNKVRVLVESLSGDTMLATRISTAISEIARALLREGDAPRIEVTLDAAGNQSRLCLTLVDKNPLPDLHRIAVFFDTFGPERRLGDEHIVEAVLRFSNHIDPRPHEIEKLKTLIQQKSRDELMAEVQARNVELQESLENLRRTRSAKERMESELNIGRDIQMSMVPAIFPPFPDRTDFTIHARLKPAREVGGDFYDFFLIDEDHLCFGVGDVSGKGVASALFMAVTKTLIKSLAKNDKSPASIMTGVNDELSDNNDSCMFVTIWLAVLNVRTGEMVTTNAGHNPPYLRRADGSVERLANRHGPIVGARAGIAYREDQLQLRRGDLLLLYTDGVTEATSVSDQLFSEERLKDVLCADDYFAVEDAVGATVRAVEEFEAGADQYDDITVMAVRFEGPDDDAKDNVLELVIKNNLAEIERVNSNFNTFAEQQALPAAVRQKINIALDELLNNIITYAYDAEGEHEIEVSIALGDQRLVITLVDRGRPFNPFAWEKPDTTKSLQEREIGGLGIHLVRKIMDDVSYERRIDKNVVKLVKRL